MSKKQLSDYIGKSIIDATFKNEILNLHFDDGDLLTLQHRGYCCEERSLSTDDDVLSLIGHKLSALTVRPWLPGFIEKDETTHEAAFFEVRSEHVYVTFAAHNAHNGNYSGISILCTNRNQEYFEIEDAAKMHWRQAIQGR